MHLNLHSSKWSHWRSFYRMLLLPIPLINLLQTSTSWNLMYKCSRTSQYYFSTNTCPPLLYKISHLIPQVFQHTSQLKFRQRNLYQFQFLMPVILSVLKSQTYHQLSHITCRLRTITQIQFMIQVTLLVNPVFLPVRIYQFFHHYSLLGSHQRSLYLFRIISPLTLIVLRCQS